MAQSYNEIVNQFDDHLKKSGKITSNLIDNDGKSIADRSFQESRRRWKYGNEPCKKNAPESAEESRCPSANGD